MNQTKRNAIFDKANDMELTLNGKRAKLSGRLKDFPSLWQVENHNFSAEYSWETIERGLEGGGDFRA